MLAHSLHRFQKRTLSVNLKVKIKIHLFHTGRFIPWLNEFPKTILQNLSHVSIKAIHDTKRSTISVNNIPNDIAHWGKMIFILTIKVITKYEGQK